MTTLLRRNDPWVVQPGWGIYVDLTPPELLNSRQIRLVRQIVISALVAVVLLCAGGYLLAIRDRSAAQDRLSSSQDITAQLQRQAQKYAGITDVEDQVTQIDGQIGSLMKGDVAIDALVNRIGAAEPAGVKLAQITVTITPAGVAEGSQTAPGGTAVDQSGHTRIGTVTLVGVSISLDSVSTFVDHLSGISGVVDAVPTSNDRTAQGSQFTINLGIDDRLLSHRFDVKGGN